MSPSPPGPGVRSVHTGAQTSKGWTRTGRKVMTRRSKCGFFQGGGDALVLQAQGACENLILLPLPFSRRKQGMHLLVKTGHGG